MAHFSCVTTQVNTAVIIAEGGSNIVHPYEEHPKSGPDFVSKCGQARTTRIGKSSHFARIGKVGLRVVAENQNLYSSVIKLAQLELVR